MSVGVTPVLDTGRRERILVLLEEAAVGADRILPALATDFDVVVLRSESELRRWAAGASSAGSASAQDPPGVLFVQGIEIDLRRHVVSVSGVIVEMTLRQRSLLAALIEEPLRAWTFEELWRRGWPDEGRCRPQVVRAIVGRLRNKLSGSGCSGRIVAVRGVGFRFDPEPCVPRLGR